MLFFTRDFSTPGVNLYPIGDLHFGSPQCEVSYIRQVVAAIRGDPVGYWVGMGDLMENAIIGSKGDVYTQTHTPKQQINELSRLLEPIKKKGLFMIGGNHEQRTVRLVGIAPDEMIAYNLDIPFMGFSCYAHLFMKSKGPRGFKCYFHHRSRRRNDPRGLRDIAPDADAIFIAHEHKTGRDPVTWYDVSNDSLMRKTGYNYHIGSTISWDGSYAEEKGYAPATVELIRVGLHGGTSGKQDNRYQTYEPLTLGGKE